MNLPRSKLKIVLGITTAGMLAAICFHGYLGLVLGWGYPYDSFLLSSTPHFSDYSNQVLAADLPNPYWDPQTFYWPFPHAVFRLLDFIPERLAMIASLFSGLAVLLLLLVKLLEKMVENPWLRVGTALLLLAVSYPVVFCVDRGNIEILTAPSVAAFIYFFSRARYRTAMLCVIPALASKSYGLLLVILMVRQRKWGLAAAAAAAFVTLNLLSILYYRLSPAEVAHLYAQSMVYYTKSDVYENNYLEESASPWNAYKVVLMLAAHAGIFPAVDFDFDGPFIRTSFSIYSALVFAYIGFLAIYICVIEKEFLRCAIPLLVLLSLSVPSGADYRLLYADFALAALVTVRTRRRWDGWAVVLLAVGLIPKKYYVFPFLGNSQTGYFHSPDISIQVLLNPLCILSATALLLYDGCRSFEPAWSAQRLRLLWRSVPLLGRAVRLPSWLPGLASRGSAAR